MAKLAMVPAGTLFLAMSFASSVLMVSISVLMVSGVTHRSDSIVRVSGLWSIFAFSPGKSMPGCLQGGCLAGTVVSEEFVWLVVYSGKGVFHFAGGGFGVFAAGKHFFFR